jgi:hypothetical protein
MERFEVSGKRGKFPDVAPFQGKDLVVIRTPRAVPWAGM